MGNHRWILVAFVIGMFAGGLEASHFRFGNLSWRQINSSNHLEVEITVTEAWRKTALGLGLLRYDFGDGSGWFNTTGAIEIADLTDVGGEDYLVFRKTVIHTYPAPGVYQVSGSSCCRISSLVNAGDAPFRLGMTIDLRQSNTGSPVAQIPAIIQMVAGTNNSIQLPVLDPDGDTFSLRMSTPLESQIPSVAEIVSGNQTNALSVSPNGLLEWDTTGGVIGSKFGVQLTIEERHKFSGVGQVPLDFIIELTDASANNPPTCTSPSTNVFYAPAGELFTLNVTAEDPDGDDLEMDVLGPTGAVTSPPVNTTAPSPMSVQFVWTPPHSMSNQSQFVSFIFRDSGGLQAVCPFTINVLPGNVAPPPEPKPPPVIIGHPVGHVALVGNNTTMEVTATSDSPMTYQWFREGSPLAGKTNSVILFTNLTLTDSGLYHVTVSNTNGPTFSRSAVLTVIEQGDLPTIVQQPRHNTNAVGQFVSFSVEVVGRPTLLYQWRRDGVPIVGAENSSLYIFNIQETNEGDYDVIIHNAYGTITSHVARLEVFLAEPPRVVSPPQSRTLLTGGDVTFSVVVESQTPINYEWLRNNTVIAGASGASYTLTNVSLNDSAAYRVRLSNLAGSLLSDAAILTVWESPAIVEQPQSVTATNSAQVVELISVATGFPVPTLQWFHEGVPLTNGVGYFGVNSTRLHIPAVSRDRLGTYRMRITSPAGTNLSASAVLGLYFPPSVIAEPVSGTVLMGGVHQFVVGVTGAPPLSVQWSRDGVPIQNGRLPKLSLTNVNRHDSGTYRLTVTNQDGSAFSREVELNVLIPQRLAAPERRASEFVLRFGAADGLGVLPGQMGILRVQTSTDLTNWVDASMGLSQTNGQVVATDTNVLNTEFKFYRVIER